MIIEDALSQAVNILRQGGLAAFPTETVYGLGADARNPLALQKIFAAKQRPIDHPLIVHIGNISQLSDWAVDISASALLLANTFWPGPLTLILKKAPGVSDLVTGNQETIGLRIPNHPVALALLQAFGSGVAAPSANRFGRISPTTAQAVQEELGSAVDSILDGGPCAVGVESTIVDVSNDEIVILRPGMITTKQIEDVLQKRVITTKKNAPRVSGSLESHYAPQTKTVLISSENMSKLFEQETKPIALLIQNQNRFKHENIYTVLMPDNAKEYAQMLYQTLRELDKKKFSQIVIEKVPEGSEWEAIRDRLERAAGTHSY